MLLHEGSTYKNYEMICFYFQHPYPTEDEKKELAQQCNLSNLQVNNWLVIICYEVYCNTLTSNFSCILYLNCVETGLISIEHYKYSRYQRSGVCEGVPHLIGSYCFYWQKQFLEVLFKLAVLLIMPQMIKLSHFHK